MGTKVRTTVLVVDDEQSFHRVVGDYLESYRVLAAYNGWQALKFLSRYDIDVVLLDLGLPDVSGLELLQRIRFERDDVEVIVITAHSDLRSAVEAVKRGAFDFLAKSYENYQTLHEHVQRALTHRRRRREQLESGTRDAWLADAFRLLQESESPAVRAIIDLVTVMARTPLTVLIEGPSGVGKEIAARYIHSRSDRAEAPFVTVNLSAVAPTLFESHLFGHIKGAFTGADRTQVGKFELADGGTLFLDEIGELSREAQVKLLRVLQEREIERLGSTDAIPINARVIAATNKDLESEVAAGRFREDLFFRLNVVRLAVPPLRERAGDIPALVCFLASKHAAVLQRDPPSFSQEAMDVLASFDWPGNIRELENLVMRLVAFHAGKQISSDDIPPEYWLPHLNKRVTARLDRVRSGTETRLYFLARDQFERYLVRYMIERSGGNKLAAARALGVSYSTLKNKVRGEVGDGASGRRSTGGGSGG